MVMLDDVATYLEANSTRFNRSNLTRSFMPDSPSTVTTLYDTGGAAPIHFFSTGATRAYEQPSLMVHSRSTDYQTVRANIRAVWAILDSVSNQTLPTATGTHYVDVSANQSPFALTRDANDRFVMSVNFSVVKSTA